MNFINCKGFRVTYAKPINELLASDMRERKRLSSKHNLITLLSSGMDRRVSVRAYLAAAHPK